MSDHNDIYRIIENLDAAQKSVKQLPALFKPAQTSPQLSGPYPGKNATRGYMVGEGESLDDMNSIGRAVAYRIANQRPEWFMKYGREAVMQAIADVTEGETDWEEIGSSDVSAYVNYVADYLRDHHGSRSEMDDRKPFAEQDTAEAKGELAYTPEPTEYGVFPDDPKQFVKKFKEKELALKHIEKFGGKLVVLDQHGRKINEEVAEGKEAATEDVLSSIKKKLGDYLQDVATAIKKDPDLVDKIPQTVDQIRAVKTITTDDGHEIKIHGNEDDGFRVTIKNKELTSKFRDLDEATMACEMYCARRRQQMENADYIEEKR